MVRRENQPKTRWSTLDKLGSVYLTGTMHDEDSPNHLLLVDGDVCRLTCEPKYNPCNHFCPARVYEMILPEAVNQIVRFANYLQTAFIVKPVISSVL